MRVRKLTALNDYSFGNGQLDFFINEPAAVGQVVKTSLLLWLGEWFPDTLVGCPYLQGVLGKYSQANADVVLQDYILQQQGVVDIQNYQSLANPDSRKLSVSLDLDTIYGPTPVQVANYANY